MDRNAEVLARIIEEMSSGMEKSRKAKAIAEKIDQGKATYDDALEYARESGRIMTGSMKRNLPEVLTDGKLYRAEADVVVRQPMKRSGKQVAETAAQIQQQLNEQAEIGINAIVPEVNEEQITGIITGICNAESYESGSGRLFSQIENFLEGTVDDCVRENAEFHYQAGLEPTIERRAVGKCCSWCSAIAGTYRYADVSNKGNDVFRRHKNCHCIVSYNPGNGSKRRQNVHSKRWTNTGRDDRINRAEQEKENTGRQLASREITNLRNEYVAKSVGAKSQNYEIMDLLTGEKYHLAEGTYIRDKEVFAGKGSRKEFVKAEQFARKYGGKVSDWQHVKGIGIIDTPEGHIEAEIHWSQCEDIGKKEMFIKKWRE